MSDSTIAHVNISTARTAAERSRRATIEILLDKANHQVLADLWQEVCPYLVDELPERQGLIEDLADFAEVLRPSLGDIQTDELCRLIQRYAGACRRHPRFVRSLSSGVGDHWTAEVTSPAQVPGAAGRDGGAVLLRDRPTAVEKLNRLSERMGGSARS
jgi:hypothetical protein